MDHFSGLAAKLDGQCMFCEGTIFDAWYLAIAVYAIQRGPGICRPSGWSGRRQIGVLIGDEGGQSCSDVGSDEGDGERSEK